MEEERAWRLERSESDKKPGSAKPTPSGQWNTPGSESSPDTNGGSGYSQPMHSQYSHDESAMEFQESPASAPSMPQVKFNGMPAPMPMPTPAPMPPMSPSMQVGMVETQVSTTTVAVDPDWSISDVLCLLHDCACQCQRTLTCIVNSVEAPRRAHQIRMLRDCADICHMAWCFLQRDSRYSLKVLKLCAQICEACADSCSAHMDLDSQRCAATCMRCAVACRSFIAIHA